MLVENYYPSPTGWLQSNYIYTYCLVEYTWHNKLAYGEQPTAFMLDNPLTDPSYSIDIEITNNDTTVNILERIPELVVLINGRNVQLGDICPEAYNYYLLYPGESVTLTATLDSMNYGGIIDIFGIDTGYLWGSPNDPDCSIRVISPDIFTGWMRRSDYKDVRVYDNGSWTL